MDDSFLSLAREILAECNKPMNGEEIWNYAIKTGKDKLIKRKSKKPPATIINNQIHEDIRINGQKSDFSKMGLRFIARNNTANESVFEFTDSEDDSTQNDNEINRLTRQNYIDDSLPTITVEKQKPQEEKFKITNTDCSDDNSKTYTLLQLAREILSECNEPMSSNEIWNYAITNGKAELTGCKAKSPATTLSSRISEDIKKNGANSDFIKIGSNPGKYALQNKTSHEVLTENYTVETNTFPQDIYSNSLQLQSDSINACPATGKIINQRHKDTNEDAAKTIFTNEDEVLESSETDSDNTTEILTENASIAVNTDQHNANSSFSKMQNNNQNISKNERALHPLLATFVMRDPRFKCYTKTIRQETSKKNEKNSDKWSHPDVVGIYFPFNNYAQETIKLIETLRDSLYKVYSFEMKWELDLTNLREYYFQAVSNSSWAHEGYIVAAKISDKPEFKEDLSRLVNAFGIGVIRLNVNKIDQSEVLYPAKTKEHLDWTTVDRLVKLIENKDFKRFVADINADAQTYGTRGKYDEVLSPEEYEKYIEEHIPAKYR